MDANGSNMVKDVAEQSRSGCTESSGLPSSNQNEITPPKRFSDSPIVDDNVITIDDDSDSDDDIDIIFDNVSLEVSSESQTQGNNADGIRARTNSHEEKVNNTTPLPPPGLEVSESASESEEDHDWETITIDDDDDEKKAPKHMICYRCTNKRTGTFRDERKYFVHVKRHILPDHFSCPECKRPFLKLEYCLSHELRVHGTPLEYEIKDPVIAKAKLYPKRDKCNEPEPSTHQIEKTDDEEIDCEDVMFYDNHFMNSTTMYPYRGPPAETMLQAYEIQHFNHPKKSKRANCIAKIAIDFHEENVKRKRDTYKLGKFSGKTGQRGNPATTNKPTPKKSFKQRPIKRVKRPGNVTSESENSPKKKPKQMRPRDEFISSSSDVDNVDVDLVPEIPQKNRRCCRRELSFQQVDVIAEGEGSSKKGDSLTNGAEIRPLQ